MTLSAQDFSLQFHPALSTDTAEYICLVNDRHNPEAIIDLLVQGKFPIENSFDFINSQSILRCVYEQNIFILSIYVFDRNLKNLVL